MNPTIFGYTVLGSLRDYSQKPGGLALILTNFELGESA